VCNRTVAIVQKGISAPRRCEQRRGARAPCPAPPRGAYSLHRQVVRHKQARPLGGEGGSARCQQPHNDNDNTQDDNTDQDDHPRSMIESADVAFELCLGVPASARRNVILPALIYSYVSQIQVPIGRGILLEPDGRFLRDVSGYIQSYFRVVATRATRVDAVGLLEPFCP
jgi:hypothetical protein